MNQLRQREEPRGEARSQRKDMQRAELGATQEQPLKSQMTGPTLTLDAPYVCSEREMRSPTDIPFGNCTFAGITPPQTKCDDSWNE